jgi:hypothetical protein
MTSTVFFRLALRRVLILFVSLFSFSSQRGISAAEAQDLPPIECPLRKAGIDPTKLKPFEEVEEYVKFLERPDRTKWQKPDVVVQALGFKGSETVVDLGAGSGYFTFRLSCIMASLRVSTWISTQIAR